MGSSHAEFNLPCDELLKTIRGAILFSCCVRLPPVTDYGSVCFCSYTQYPDRPSALAHTRPARGPSHHFNLPTRAQTVLQSVLIRSGFPSAPDQAFWRCAFLRSAHCSAFRCCLSTCRASPFCVSELWHPRARGAFHFGALATSKGMHAG